jgi:hypothetical protein
MKSFFKILISCICLLGFTVFPCNAKDWNGIIPLQSTYNDVIKILGAPKKPLWSEYEYFEFNGDKVFFKWVDPTCTRKNPLQISEKVTPSDLVLNFSVSPKVPLSFSDKNYPFQKMFAFHCFGHRGKGGSCFYYDPDIGFSFGTVDKDITALEFFATSEAFKEWNTKHKGCFKPEVKNN